MLRLIHFLFMVTLSVVVLILNIIVEEAIGAEPAAGDEIVAQAVVVTTTTDHKISRDSRNDRRDRDREGDMRYFPRRRRDRIQFRYLDDDFDDVFIMGSFNGWVREPMALDEDLEVWSISFDLEKGSYEYKFFVVQGDERWNAIDPSNPDAQRYPEQGWVSLLRIQGNGSPRRPGDDRDWDDDDERDRDRRRRNRDWDRWSDRRWNRHFDLDWDMGEDGDGIFEYQRADGLVLGVTPHFRGYYDYEPTLHSSLAYGFKSERWSATVTVIQPLLPDRGLLLSASGYARTDFTDQTGIGSLENTAAAIFFKEDFRDYYRREGITLGLTYLQPRWLDVEAGFRSDDYSSLERAANWSWGGGRWIENPAIDDGTMRSFYASLTMGTEYNHLQVDFEASGDDVAGGDYEFTQLTGQYRARMWLGPRQHLDLRLKSGSNFRGELPVQKQYVIGGLGTVRGYGYRSLLTLDPQRDPAAPVPLGGERMALVNAEYVFSLDGDLDMVLFFDSGMAWESREAEFEVDQWQSSLGLGFQFDEGGLRINVAKGLDDEDRDPIVQIRLNRMF